MSRLALSLSFLVFAACGAALHDPIPLNECNGRMAQAITDKCGVHFTFDCKKAIGPAADACTEFDGLNVDTCEQNVRAAANCEAAQKVACVFECR